MQSDGGGRRTSLGLLEVPAVDRVRLQPAAQHAHQHRLREPSRSQRHPAGADQGTDRQAHVLGELHAGRELTSRIARAARVGLKATWVCAVAALATALAWAWVAGWQLDVVQSGSMAPTLARNSLVVIVPATAR